MVLKSVVLVLATIGLTKAQFTNPFVNYMNSDYTITSVMQGLADIAMNTANYVFVTNGADTVPLSQDVTFWCNSRKYPNVQQVFINDSQVASKIDFSKPMVLLIHGWIDTVNASWVLNTRAGEYKIQFLEHLKNNNKFQTI